MSQPLDSTHKFEKIADDWRERPYLIIGGTTKAATTSLFNYLGAHPQVGISSMKETRFFLDPDYPLDSKYRMEEGAEKYSEFFQQKSATTRLWVEATPDYLYSRGTPAKIRQTLKNVRLVFVLREPKERAVSWYRFARQNGLLPEGLSFEEYITLQLNNNSSDNFDQHMRAVEQGRYEVYLRPYFETFSKDQILVVFMEELARDPYKIMRELCNFAKIDPSFYESYEFEVHNRTENLKNPTIHGLYRHMRFVLKKKVHNRPVIKSFLRQLRLWLEPIYFSINRHPTSEGFEIPDSIIIVLNTYYRNENERLAELLGRSLPLEWSTNNAASSN